jgi:thiol-disulfide isomerase/thioredoxin
MKRNFLFLFTLILSVVTAHGQARFIELPFQTVDTFGPFLPGPLSLDLTDLTTAQSKRSYHVLKGVPSSWKGTKQGVIPLDNNQYVVQRLKAGVLSNDEYKDYQTESHWSTNPQELSFAPIRCFVYIVTGIDEKGHYQALVDANNNLDVSDEQPFEPVSYASLFNSLEAATTRQIHYERYQNAKVVKAVSKMAVWRSTDGIKISFPVYGQATFPESGERIAVVSAGFSNPNFLNSVATVLTDSVLQRVKSSGRGFSTRAMSKEGEYLSIGQDTYQYAGVDLAKQVIRLKKMNRTDTLYSTQQGYVAPPFTAVEFTTQKPLSLTSLRGRYVLLDFWGTWCAPCRAEMPSLKMAYEQFDRSKIEFIGIVTNDTPDKLRQYLDQEKITWPQLLSEKADKIAERYRVNSYPTTVLLDPQGKVVLTNVRGYNLLQVLYQLTKPKN